MEAEDLLDDVHGLAGEGGDAGVVDGEDGDGLAVVDVLGELGLGEVVAEGAERGVLGEDFGDVKGSSGRREEEEEDEKREEENGKGRRIRIRERHD